VSDKIFKGFTTTFTVRYYLFGVGLMRRLRDVFYISANFDDNFFVYYGMEFKEFIRYCPINLENILITDGYNIANNFNYNWLLETANGKEEILELSKEDIYGLGNFHWLDYCKEEELNNCSPEEKAEVLYLSHFGKPIKFPFINKLQNNFCYLAHDDGWFCKLYCKDMLVFGNIISDKIIESFSTNKRRKIYPMTDEIKDKLIEFTKSGLLIDFSSIFSGDNLFA
jgi:hypothetical protein